MSDLPLIATEERTSLDVSNVPEADMLTTDEAQRFVDRPSLPLIDDLVRRHQQCLRHDQPQRLRGLKVDDEIYIV